MLKKLLLIALIAVSGVSRIHAADVIDRVMAAVNRQPILLSDVNAALVFELVPRPQGGDPLASTLDRLIERTLILEEVERFQPPEPAPEEIDKRVDAIVQRFGARAAFEKGLASVGMTEAQLRARIRDDLRSATYINQRFGETDPGARETLIAEWAAGLRRRADVTIPYLASSVGTVGTPRGGQE
jgi:parvulin-like peptidyl-prolyl isomerase